LSITNDNLKLQLIDSLVHQGFELRDERLLLPSDLTKEKLRELHKEATRHRIARSREGLAGHESILLARMAHGQDLVPEDIRPEIVQVQPDSEDELLFRYASLHWTIPVSSGYGRRLRFLILDGANRKLIGIVGLGDPVFSLAHRDSWIGWTKEDRRERLHHVMDAFVLGAVPPYSYLLCGKLVAMLVASNEVREAFKQKYAGRTSLIQKRVLQGELALVTTTSALGRSSVYNRIGYAGRLLYQSVGFTKGYGEFHFSNGMYSTISEYVVTNCKPTAKHALWGTGFRSRREVVKKCLAAAGLSAEWLNHGIQREIFVVPLASNSARFLTGQDASIQYYDQPASKLAEWFQERWLLPRSQWDKRYLSWEPDTWRLWPEGSRNA